MPVCTQNVDFPPPEARGYEYVDSPQPPYYFSLPLIKYCFRAMWKVRLTRKRECSQYDTKHKCFM